MFVVGMLEEGHSWSNFDFEFGDINDVAEFVKMVVKHAAKGTPVRLEITIKEKSNKKG